MTHTSFIRIRHCLLTLCLRLIEPRFGKIVLLCNKFIYGGQHLIKLAVAAITGKTCTLTNRQISNPAQLLTAANLES